MGFIVLPLQRNQKNRIMKIVVLVKHIEKKIILTMYFKNEDQIIEWWSHFPCSEEWEIIYEGKREKSGHRYELTYSKFDECGKLYSKYIICHSKKESLTLKRKINEANSSYIITIKKLY